MDPHQLSSGDLIADRRAEYAHMLADSGDHEGAADLMGQALELVPDWAAGWFRRAEYEEKSGRKAAAVEALERVVALNPGDIFGAGLKLALLGASDTPEQPPSRYVERLFDDYADRFDTALVEKLDYSVPEKLANLIAKHVTESRLGHVVDLGCGTGLLGERIRDRTDHLEGFDLSANMLAKAEGKGHYDQLAQADLSLPLEQSGLFGDNGKEGRADLVTAADVLMYLGNLKTVFASVSRLLGDRGVFAFSIEDAGEDRSDFVLRSSLRYAHGETYVRRLCEAHGFYVVDSLKTVIRKDGGEPVHGILFLARKTA